MKDREKIIRYFAATSDDAKDMAIRLLDLGSMPWSARVSALH